MKIEIAENGKVFNHLPNVGKVDMKFFWIIVERLKRASPENFVSRVACNESGLPIEIIIQDSLEQDFFYFEVGLEAYLFAVEGDSCIFLNVHDRRFFVYNETRNVVLLETSHIYECWKGYALVHTPSPTP